MGRTRAGSAVLKEAIITFDTLSDMIASTLIIGELYRTQGYSTEGVGGGVYRIVAGDTSDLYINPSVNSGADTAVLQDNVTPQRVGAVGDGVADDTARMQAVLDSIPTGGELWLGHGDWLISGLTIPAHGITIHGSGNTSQEGLKGSRFIKAASSTAVGLLCSGEDVRLFDLVMTGAVGNTNAGIQFSGSRPVGTRLSVFDQGGDGIRIGTDGTNNVNLWYLEGIIADGNGGHGVHVHGNTGNNPDVNGGTLNHLDTRNNTLDGLYVNNAWLNVFIGCTAQVNTRYGINLTSESENNKIIGGDQDEVNVAGNVLNAGVGNVFVGTSDNGFTDSGTNTVILNRNTSKLPRLGLSAEPADGQLLAGTVAFAGTDTLQRWDSVGNPAANRGYSIEYNLPSAGGATAGVKQIMARTAANENSKVTWQVKVDGSALADTMTLDSTATARQTRMLLYDVDKGTISRVFVGIADSAESGYKVLMMAN